MSSEFELRRLEEKREKLLEEQKELNQKLPTLRKDEIYEIESLRREFNLKIGQVESRLKGIAKELEGLERQEAQLKRRIEKGEETEQEDDDETRRRPFGLF